MPDEGVPVGVQARRRHRDHDVARHHPLGPEQLVGLDHPGARTGDVVLVRGEQPGCSAVSPPTSAAPASRQPSATPETMAAIRSGTTRPQAM